MHPILTKATLVVALASLAACGTAYPTQTTSPSVTYSYTEDDDYDDVAERANDYCDDQYDKRAVLLDRETEGTKFEATFSCE